MGSEEVWEFQCDCAGQLGGCAAKRKLSQVIGVLISSTATRRGSNNNENSNSNENRNYNKLQCRYCAGRGGRARSRRRRTRSKSGSQSFVKEADKKSICFYFSGRGAGRRLSGVSDEHPPSFG